MINLLIRKIRIHFKVINLFRKATNSENNNSNSIVLIEYYLNLKWLYPNLELLKSINRIKKIKTSPFSTSFYGKISIFLLSLISKNIYFPFPIFFPRLFNNRYEILWQNLIKNFSREKLLNFKYKNMEIGIDIYESFIYENNLATIYKPCNVLKKLFFDALKYSDDYEKIFEKEKISAVIISHPDYYPSNVIAKLAYKYSIPVFLVNFDRVALATKPFSLRVLYENLSNIYLDFEVAEKEEFQSIGQSFILKRLKGETVKEIPYITNSIHKDNEIKDFSNIKIKNLKKYQNLNLIVFVHDYVDTPHALDKLNNSDFFEWLIYVCEEVTKTGYNCFLKTHIDASDLTIKTTADIVKNFPNIKIMPKNTSINKILKMADLIITAYGTCATEFPYFGIPVICTDVNKFSSFKFIYTLKKREKLHKILLQRDLWELNNIKQIQKEIEKYAFMEYKYLRNEIFQKAHSYYLDQSQDYEKIKKIVDSFVIEMLKVPLRDMILTRKDIFIKY